MRFLSSFFPPDAVTYSHWLCTCWGAAFLLGVTTLTWACLQYSGPMDLKEKRAVGHIRLPRGDCLCVCWNRYTCVYLGGPYLGALNQKWEGVWL